MANRKRGRRKVQLMLSCRGSRGDARRKTKSRTKRARLRPLSKNRVQQRMPNKPRKRGQANHPFASMVETGTRACTQSDFSISFGPSANTLTLPTLPRTCRSQNVIIKEPENYPVFGHPWYSHLLSCSIISFSYTLEPIFTDHTII